MTKFLFSKKLTYLIFNYLNIYHKQVYHFQQRFIWFKTGLKPYIYGASSTRVNPYVAGTLYIYYHTVYIYIYIYKYIYIYIFIYIYIYIYKQYDIYIYILYIYMRFQANV